MNKGGPTPYGCHNMDGLCHFPQTGALFQTSLGKGINTVRALDRVGYGKSYEGLFPFGEFTLCKY